MESVPSDIVRDIVSRVPVESVLECKLVCKEWGTLIRENNFTNVHLRRQLNNLHGGDDGDDNRAAKVESRLFFACCIDNPGFYKTLLFHGGQPSDRISIDDKYIYNQKLTRIYHPPMHNKPLYDHLVGSCNGLVCTIQHHNLILDPIYICNPLTREYVYLPELVVKKEDFDPDFLRIVGEEVNMRGKTASGFGYVQSTKEYKVVRIHYVGLKEGIVQVYTLGSGCGWRTIDRVLYRMDTAREGRGNGTYSNDSIYWISGRKVVVFDLAKEEFRLLSGPPCLQDRRINRDICGLVALGRRLCFYMDKLRMEIWSLMTSSSDSNETWCMEFGDIDYEAIVGSPRFRPILLTKNGEIIFLHDRSVLYCYDTKTTLLRVISDKAFEYVEAIAHIDTFVSLEAMGENSKRHTVRTPSDEDDEVIDHELDRVALVDQEIDSTRFRLR